VSGALLIVRVADRPAALERVLGLLRRKRLAIRRLSLTAADDMLELVLRLDTARTLPERLRAELLALVDVQEVTDVAEGFEPRTFELALALLTPGGARALPESFRVVSDEHSGPVVAITGGPEHVDAELARLREHGVLSRSARSGEVAVPRGSQTNIPERET